jgi:hypothetical protein
MLQSMLDQGMPRTSKFGANAGGVAFRFGLAPAGATYKLNAAGSNECDEGLCRHSIKRVRSRNIAWLTLHPNWKVVLHRIVDACRESFRGCIAFVRENSIEKRCF